MACKIARQVPIMGVRALLLRLGKQNISEHHIKSPEDLPLEKPIPSGNVLPQSVILSEIKESVPFLKMKNEAGAEEEQVQIPTMQYQSEKTLAVKIPEHQIARKGRISIPPAFQSIPEVPLRKPRLESIIE